MEHSRMTPFPLWEHCCVLANCSFAAELAPPPNLLDYGTVRVMQQKGNAMAPPKMGTMKRTVWQLGATN
jgi:hypothetical protein